MVVAQFGTGQVFWSLLWFFLFFMWLMLIFNVFGDIIRSDDMSGGSKAIWAIVIIFLPYLGIFAYLIARGDKMHARQAAAMEDQEAAFRDYVRDASGGSAGELERLAELHTAGKINDEEFAKAKAKIIG